MEQKKVSIHSLRLNGSPVATVLGTVKSKEDVAEFYKRYFHDFIREVHLATHAESGQEYKVSNRCLMRNNCYYKSINIAFLWVFLHWRGRKC